MYFVHSLQGHGSLQDAHSRLSHWKLSSFSQSKHLPFRMSVNISNEKSGFSSSTM